MTDTPHTPAGSPGASGSAADAWLDRVFAMIDKGTPTRTLGIWQCRQCFQCGSRTKDGVAYAICKTTRIEVDPFGEIPESCPLPPNAPGERPGQDARELKG